MRLGAAQALLGQLAENTLAGIYLIQDGRIAYANPALERMLGYEAEGLVGADAYSLIQPDDRPAVAKNLGDRLAGLPAAGPSELRARHRNGKTRHLQVMGAVVEFGGRPAVLGTALDVTDRVATQTALKTTEEQYRFVADHVDDVLWRLDVRSRRFTFVSPSIERLCGMLPDEIMAATVDDILGPDAVRLIEARLQEHLAAMRAGANPPPQVRMRVELPKKGGGSVATEIAAAALLTPQGKPVELVGVTRNIEERENAEQALRESESRFRTLIAEAPLAIGVSREGVTISVNDAYLRLFGLTSEADLIGRSLGDQIAPSSRPFVLEMSHRRAMGLPAPTVYEAVGLRHDGSEFPMHVAVAQVRLPDGPATVGFLTDLTELKQAEGDLAFGTWVESAIIDALHRLPANSTADDAAAALCDALWSLPKVDFAAVFGFSLSDEIAVLAHRAPPDFPPSPSHDMRTRMLHDQAARGPHAEYWVASPEGGTWETALTRMGLRAVVYAPIVHGDHVDGLLMVGTCDPVLAGTFVERLTAVVDLTSTPSALLAERLHARRIEIETRARLEQIIRQGAFRTVFQPIVDLSSGQVVGHEALTRFSSGQRPDLCFADAWRVGIGLELELATLERAIEAARVLPEGQWLDLNVSPRMLGALEALRATLSKVDRPVVLEVTEHEAIGDYPAVREGLRRARSDAWLAVDDAGAGVANFAHIVELRADFVKLDMGIVRGVDADLGRQALVIGMRHFARTAGCTLVAEGVETQEEAETLRHLGVELGQGFLFGRPGPAPQRGRRRTRS